MKNIKTHNLSKEEKWEHLNHLIGEIIMWWHRLKTKEVVEPAGHLPQPAMQKVVWLLLGTMTTATSIYQNSISFSAHLKADAMVDIWNMWWKLSRKFQLRTNINMTHIPRTVGSVMLKALGQDTITMTSITCLTRNWLICCLMAQLLYLLLPITGLPMVAACLVVIVLHQSITQSS